MAAGALATYGTVVFTMQYTLIHKERIGFPVPFIFKKW